MKVTPDRPARAGIGFEAPCSGARAGRLVARAAGVVAFVAALAVPRAAKAQATDRHVQLSLSANLFAYETHRLSASENHVSLTDTTFGPGPSGLGLGFGYGLTSKWLLSMQLLGSSSRSGTDIQGSSDLHTFGYSILPRVEYLFGPGASVAPYLGATLGLRGNYSFGAPGSKVSSTDFALGAVAGLRSFLAPGFSIDPNVMLLGTTGTERVGGVDYDRSGFTLLFGVALSGWLDTRGTSAGHKFPSHTAPRAPSGTVATTTDGEGTVRGEIALGQGRKLTLLGRPIHHGKEVVITLVGGSSEQVSLVRCTEALAVVDGSERALSGVHAVPGTESSLEAIISPLLLRDLGLANYGAKVVACGATWEISPEAQAGLLEFFASFREIAERYGQ